MKSLTRVWRIYNGDGAEEGAGLEMEAEAEAEAEVEAVAEGGDKGSTSASASGGAVCRQVAEIKHYFVIGADCAKGNCRGGERADGPRAPRGHCPPRLMLSWKRLACDALWGEVYVNSLGSRCREFGRRCCVVSCGCLTLCVLCVGTGRASKHKQSVKNDPGIMRSVSLVPTAFAVAALTTRCTSNMRRPVITMCASENVLPDTADGWRTVLSPNQFAVLRRQPQSRQDFQRTPAASLNMN